MKKREKQSIFRSEHAAEIAAMPPPPPELLPLLEQDAGRLGVADPSEMIWTGGKDPIDLHTWLRRDLDDVGALDQILLAIIGSNCSFAYPPAEGTADAKAIRRRLEQAKRYLLDREAKQGPPVTIDTTLLRIIAERYWLAYAGVGSDASLWAIAADVVLPNYASQGLNHAQVDGPIRPYVNAFNKEKDRLLLQVSARGVPEAEDRRTVRDRIINLLIDLEIVRPTFERR